MPPSTDNSRLDFLGNTAVQDHLTNWGPWTWALMIVIAVILCAVAVITSNIAPGITPTWWLITTFVVTAVYCFWPLLLIVRHLTHTTAVWVMWGSFAIFVIGLVIGRVYTGVIHWTSFIGAGLFHLGVYFYDKIARTLADFPLAWVTVVMIFGVCALLVIRPTSKR